MAISELNHEGELDASLELLGNRYARLPLAVILDGELTAHAVRVYCVLVSCLRYTGTVSVGMRWLAKRSFMSTVRAQQAIKELARREHVKVLEVGKGMRNVYVMTNPIFHEKQGKERIALKNREGRWGLASIRSEERFD